MSDIIETGFKANTEAFSIATLIYIRLRRVTGRVIDAMYLVENKQYAKHIIEFAVSTQDKEILHQVERLQTLIDLELEPIEVEPLQDEELSEDSFSQVTEEEIYRAQIPHHYIDVLR